MKTYQGRQTTRQRLLASCGKGNAYTTRMLISAGLAAAMGIVSSPHAQAFNLYDGSQAGNNLEINLTTTLSYTGLMRVNSPSALLDGNVTVTPGALTGSPIPQTNSVGNDGDRNFQHGLVGNLFEAVPVLDIRDGDFGAHVSGQIYLNTSYLGTTQNGTHPNSAIFTAKTNDFTSATRNVDGENAQLLDAFVFGQHDFADGQVVQLKVGRQTLLWGQSLFFPTDGISGGQAPIDVVTAQNSINPQAQQVFLPVGQVVLTYHPVQGTTLQGFYQFEWEHDYFQGEGAYFNGANYVGPGASTVILPPFEAGLFGISGTNAYFERSKDLDPEHQNGQFGLSLQQEVGDYDFGVFVERFDAKAPAIYANPGIGIGTPLKDGIQAGTFNLVYPRDILLQGASFSTNVGAANVAGEFSVREHDPLIPANFCVEGEPESGSSQNANGSQLCPVGDVWDAQISEIYVTPGIPLDPGGVSILGEAIVNHLIKVTSNREGLRPFGQATAAAFDLSVTPTYNDVLPSLNVTFPIGLTYDFLGRSEVDSSIQHGNAILDVGVAANYKVVWNASISYQDYLGKASLAGEDTTYNTLADRGFVSFNIQRSF